MKESFGNAFVFMLVMIFVTVALFILIGSMSYSKSAKIKNRIVSIVENYVEINGDAATTSTNQLQTNLSNEIDASLSTIGYRINKSGNQNNGKVPDNCKDLTQFSNYRYSVFRCCAERGHYYKITAYMYFDFPLIGDLLEIPIRGDTKIFYRITPGNDC